MKFKKELKLIDVFCISTGAMISSGLFILPGLAHAKAGPAVVVSYFLAGLLALIGVLSISELSTAMPKAGGDYFFITRGFGPAIGTVAGMLSWFSLSLKSAFALVGMAAFVRLIIDLNMHIVAVFLCIVFVSLNFIGVKEASITQIILVAILLSILLIYVVWSLPQINVHRFDPFAPYGIYSVFSTAGFVFVAYGGLLKIASVSEEVRDPCRTLPLGLMLSLVVTTILYGAVVFTTSGVVEASNLDLSFTPISDGAYITMGIPGLILLSAAAILAFISTANAGIMSASRYPFALSRDKLYPAFFGRVHKKFKTPYVSIFFTGFFIIVFLFLELDILIKVASTIVIMTYILSILSVIVLRSSKLQNYKPGFKTPLYPWIQILGLMGFIFIIFEMGRDVIILSIVLVIIGACIYIFYGRKRTRGKEYALLYVIDGITSKSTKLTDRGLENELKKIVYERDKIKKDSFHRAIEKCTVLDIKESMYIDILYRKISESLSDKLYMEPEYFYSKFSRREKESSTLITDKIAIPNIVIGKKDYFNIIITRCRDGILFPGSESRVIAAFLL
ncbi:MAG: amino acid permease [Actinomycetota bacterium]|nr:amino acid permease [Actinomycetota bacterium]